MARIRIEARQKNPPPDWVLRQRRLIDLMNEAAPICQERYTRADGTFVWREEWMWMDATSRRCCLRAGR